MLFKPVSTEAQALAVQAADDYFNALAEDLPFDTAPGAPLIVNLIERANQIQDAILDADRATLDRVVHSDDLQDSALRAGYLLGVQIGLRMRGGCR
jgi:hypothetical protein